MNLSFCTWWPVWTLLLSVAEVSMSVNDRNATVFNELSRITLLLKTFRTNQIREHKQSQEAEVFIQAYPHLIRNHTIRNFYLKNSSAHKTSVQRIVYLAQYGEASSSRSCVETMSSRLPVLGVNVTAGVQQDLKVTQSFDLSICPSPSDSSSGIITSGCAYFIMAQDPVQAAASSHQYCQESSGDPECAGIPAGTLSLKQWIMYRGSLLFLQLVTSNRKRVLKDKTDLHHWSRNGPALARTCHPWTGPMLHQEEVSSTSQNLPADITSELAALKNPPCWVQKRLYLQSMKPSERKLLLQYVLRHLEHWFTVVGIQDDVARSMQMFSNVFHMPFNECATNRSGNPTSTSGGEGNSSTRRKSIETEVNSLYDDVEVREALMEDLEIYKKLKQIYNVQKQIKFNTK